MECTPELLQRLSKLELFSDFDLSQEKDKLILEKICALLDKKDFKAGDLIIHEGDVGDMLYILYKGTVQVMRNTLSQDRFAVVNLASEQNVFFGEIALIDNDKRSASVAALTDCCTLTLKGKDFLALCEEEPVLGFRSLFRIAKRIAGSLRRANEDTITLYQALLDEVEGSADTVVQS